MIGVEAGGRGQDLVNMLRDSVQNRVLRCPPRRSAWHLHVRAAGPARTNFRYTFDFGRLDYPAIGLSMPGSRMNGALSISRYQIGCAGCRRLLCRSEESSGAGVCHALAGLIERLPALNKNDLVVLNLSGPATRTWTLTRAALSFPDNK